MKGKTSPIIIGTRGSDLALWQANFTKHELEKNGYSCSIQIIKTKGDATQQWNLSFDKIEGKGFFTKELEDALLENEIDLAVHSCKDLPTENSAGLTITAFSKRANPFDILLIRKESVDESKPLKLKANVAIGTSSARRKAQLLAIRPDAVLQDMRGNVPTRVKKLSEKNYDAIVLASAGLERLNIDLTEFEQVQLKSPMFIPAPAQGVLAFQIRESDEEMKNICACLNDEESYRITSVERKILHDFQGGCQIPLGVFSKIENEKMHTWVSYAEAWNAIPKRVHISTPIAQHDFSFLLKKIKHHQPKSVFISTDLKDDDYFKRILEAHHFLIHHESLIEFKPLEFATPENADWLFFSSKNGVKFYFDHAKKNDFIKIAAINGGTANSLYELGLKVDFVGEGSDLEKITSGFDQIASGKIVFPQAQKSMQSIQKNLFKNKNIETLVVYENRPKSSVLKRDEDILVFMSPMSVDAYFDLYSLEKHQSVISIGNTTTKKLTEKNITGIHTAYEPSMWSVVDEVFSIA